MTFNITDSVFIRYDVARYADTLCALAKNLWTTYNGTLRVNNITLGMFCRSKSYLLGYEHNLSTRLKDETIGPFIRQGNIRRVFHQTSPK